MGMIFKAPGFIIYLVCGFWGLFICFGIVQKVLGTALAVISVFLAPFLLTLAPWFQALAYGDWFPLGLVYGGGVIGTILIGIGSAIDKD